LPTAVFIWHPAGTPQHLVAMPKVRLDEAPVQRGSMLWTWDGCLTTGILNSIPVRMVIAGYKLGSATGLVVISPLEPTAAVIEWVRLVYINHLISH
jgi:hypothetical protein